MDAALMMTTCPTRSEAETLATALVGRRLAGCVQAVPVTSTYTWDGAVQNDAEVLLLIKAPVDRVAAIRSAVAELHSYDLPELVVLPIVDGSTGYLDWLTAATR